MEWADTWATTKSTPEDKELTALRTPKGVYWYMVITFVLKNAWGYQTYELGCYDCNIRIPPFTTLSNECYVDDLVVKTETQKIFDRQKKDQKKEPAQRVTFLGIELAQDSILSSIQP